MKEKKLQIFVSSTYLDLKEERQAAVEAILSSGHIPAGMELFAAGDESQMSVIERWIEESDVYLLILGGRYGSVDSNSGKSYTQLEYEYASSINKPSFALVISEKGLDEKVKTIGRTVIEDFYNKELKEFRTLVLKKLVKFCDDKKDIKIAIHETLSDLSYRKEMVGWVKGDNIVNAGVLAEEIARLTKENTELRSKVKETTNDSNALYAGLSYSQLKDLLERDKFQVEGKELSLLDLIIDKGKDIALGGIRYEFGESTRENRAPYDKLARLYKLLRDVGDSELIYVFSDTGHNFYLKALINSTT